MIAGLLSMFGIKSLVLETGENWEEERKETDTERKAFSPPNKWQETEAGKFYCPVGEVPEGYSEHEYPTFISKLLIPFHQKPLHASKLSKACYIKSLGNVLGRGREVGREH